ncbi:methyltransferase domain-containing protein [Amycolatopsis thailandensis]|uniref:methyltransferase domain-containing protein n=1 Tax=Amycolatopsis thailandensis TaxID=589330 RepID=UPI003635A0DF
MTATTAPWRELAHQLAEQLASEGVLQSPEWRAAVEAVPRHVFVPCFYTQQPDGQWTETTGDSAQWLEQVYRNEPLITALAVASNGNRVTVSSSTKPGLMVRMLEVLEVENTHRVLEIGTGTGYNAGLLAHRLGDEQVFSVDIGAGLVGQARDRLAELGLAPTIEVAHGAGGLPKHAPFDRIVATCSLPAIPWTWAEQVREGGLVLVDFKRSVHAGSLVLLTRREDRLEGRFLSRWAGFMAIRDTDTAPAGERPTIKPTQGKQSWTTLPPLPWESLVPWFLAQIRMPSPITFGYRGATEQGHPEWAVFTADEGSWCAVRTEPDGERREVRQGGLVHIWDEFEAVHGLWHKLGEPGWDRLGLTVMADGFHRVWLDDPDGNFRWTLPRFPAN